MTFIRTFELEISNQLLITLPEHFKSGKKVRVIVEEVDDELESKIELMKMASKDPLFLSDIEEIANDFKYADFEEL